MVRGYGRIREAESMLSDDDNSEDDIDDTLVISVYVYTFIPFFELISNNILNLYY